MLRRKNKVSYENGFDEYGMFQESEPEIELDNDTVDNEELNFDGVNANVQDEVSDESISDEMIEGASEIMSMLFISVAQITPYWSDKKRELEEKYGSIDAFNEKLKNNISVAIKGNKWLRSILLNSSIAGNIISMLPLLTTLYELFKPPMQVSNDVKDIKQEEVQIVEDTVNRRADERKFLTPGVYPIE